MDGRPVSFGAALDARFNSDSTRFEALRSWAEKPTPQELSLHYRRRPGSKAVYDEQVPCWEADHKGLLRAMTVAAGGPDRRSSLRVWRDVETAFRHGQQVEAQSVEKAKIVGRSRPTTLGRDLAIRAARDQSWRDAEVDEHYDDRTSEAIVWRSWSRMCHIGADNISFVKSLVAKGRWPIMSRDGEAATHDAFLIVQHADDDPEFQERMLELLKPLVDRGEFLGRTYAALYDRVALAKGQPQRYATQFGEGKHGCSALRPVEDPKNIDHRRATVGLQPLAEYAKLISEKYHTRICDNILDTNETQQPKR